MAKKSVMAPRVAPRACPRCRVLSRTVTCGLCGRDLSTSMTDIFKAPFSPQAFAETVALLAEALTRHYLPIVIVAVLGFLLSLVHPGLIIPSLALIGLLCLRLIAWSFGTHLAIVDQFASGAVMSGDRRSISTSIRDLGYYLAVVCSTFGAAIVLSLSGWLWGGGLQNIPTGILGGMVGFSVGCLYGPMAMAMAGVYQTVNPARVLAMIRRCLPAYILLLVCFVPFVAGLLVVQQVVFYVAAKLLTTMPSGASLGEQFFVFTLAEIVALIVVQHITVSEAAMLGMLLRRERDESVFTPTDLGVGAAALVGAVACTTVAALLIARGWIDLATSVDGRDSSRFPRSVLTGSAAQGEPPPTAPEHLLAAATSGDVELVESLLLEDHKARDRHERGSTFLHLAAAQKHPEVLDVLVADGADVDALDENGWTPLVVAAQSDQLGAARILLAAGADVNTVDKHGNTLLQDVASRYSTNMARVLLSNGADINAANEHGYTALHCAVREERTEMAALLLESGAEVDASGAVDMDRPLHGAASTGNAELVQLLLDHGADHGAPDSTFDWTALHHAARAGHREVIEVLLANGADVNATGGDEGKTALQYALEKEHPELAILLLDNGATFKVPPSYRNGGSLLHYAASRGYVDVANALIDKGANVNAKDGDDLTPLHSAVVSDQVEVAELLIAQGAKVDAKSKHGKTPLYWAVYRRNLGTVQCLLDGGADVNAKTTSSNTTLLHILVEVKKTEGVLDVAEALIAARADVDARDKAGRTPLHLASRTHKPSVVELLLDNGADPNAKDEAGQCPLHFAVVPADLADPELVELLLRHGADVNAKDKKGDTPLARFRATGGFKTRRHRRAVQTAGLLEAHGAQ